MKISSLSGATARRLLFSTALAVVTLPLSVSAGTLVAGGGQWKVRQVNVNFVPANLLQGELALTGFGSIGEANTLVDQVDFGTVGNFTDLNMEFPGLSDGENNFAMEIAGQIEVTTPGDITFGVFADDLLRLEIGGVTVVETTAVNADAFGTVNLAAGTYDVRVIFYEAAGTSDIELFVAEELGTFTALTEADFELLDSVADHSPTDITADSASFPVNGTAGGAVANLSASGGAGGGHRFELVYPIDVASPLNLFAAGSGGWSYLDDGSLPASDWQSAGFDDSLWLANGAAPLGYSDASIVTPIIEGPDAATRHAAYYFRNTFAVPVGELERIDSVTLKLARDDGAAVYINGVEVVRDNLPAGPLDNTTLANITAGGAAETTLFEYVVDRSVFVEGVNTIAAEVHQANLTSSDVVFDMAIDYQRRADLTGDVQNFEIIGNQLLLKQDASAIPASNGQTYNVPVRAINAYGASFEETISVGVAAAANGTPIAISLNNSSLQDGPAGRLVGTIGVLDGDVGDSHVFEFNVPALFPDTAAFAIVGNELRTVVPFDAAIKASYSISIKATDSVGLSASSNFTITVTPPPSRVVLTPDTVPENAPEFTVAAELSTTDPITDQHTYRLLVGLDPVPESLIAFADTWSYLADGSDPGSVWTGRNFDDSSWLTGGAPLGYGVLGAAPDALSPTTTVSFGGDADNKFPTTFFRRTFQVANPALIEELVLDMAIDDAAIGYLNGQEVFRVRAGAIAGVDDYSGSGDGGETTNDVVTVRAPFPELLVSGDNVLAVEIHQSGPTSSDLWLDVSMDANLRTQGTDSDHFYLVGNQIRVNKEVAEIPAEDGDSFTLQVESTSLAGEVIVEDVVINVGPVSANPPTDIALDNTAIDEGLPIGTLVGRLSATDIDGGAFGYRLEPNALFPANAQFTTLGDQLTTAVPIDFDDGSVLNIRITATDNTGLEFSKNFTITIGQVLGAPTALALAPGEFPFDAEIGTSVGVFAVTDENSAEVHTLTFGSWPDIPGDAVLSFGSLWSYLDDGSDQGTVWQGVGFDDSAWAMGNAELGYGDNDEATVVEFVDADDTLADVQKNATTYFRTNLNIPVLDPRGYAYTVKYDDAVAIYINGTQVYRSGNLAAGATFDTYATANRDQTNTPAAILDGALIAGDNVIAVEIHQSSVTSSDISFDLEIAPFIESPYPAYFSIAGEELLTAVDFTTVGISPPFTFQVPINVEDPSGLMFETTVPVNVLGGASDTDLDGLLDTWEIDNFGDLAQGAGGDPDNDGRSNADEYGADTDPNNAADFLQISSISVGAAGSATVTWPAKPDRTYALYRSDDLAGGNWVLVEGGLTTAVAADLSSTDLLAPVPGDRFYRVEAQAPPLP